LPVTTVGANKNQI